LTNVREPDGGARSLSGECRIEAISLDGQARLIDGLRLRLDLRLAPSSRRQGSQLPALTRQVQKLAAMVALGALLTALLVWFLWAPAAPPISVAPLPTAPPDAVAAPAPAAEVAAAVQTAAAGGPGVRLPGEPVKPLASESSGSAAKGTVGVAPTSRPVARPGRTAPSPSAGNVGAPIRPATAASSAAVSPRVPNRDLIDLFGDTK
jgi:hypothetical protein